MGVFIGEIMGCVMSCCYSYFAYRMLTAPLNDFPHDGPKKAVVLMFWKSQGMLLFTLSTLAAVAFVVFGMMDARTSKFPCAKVWNVLFGFLQYEVGRALFLIVV